MKHRKKSIKNVSILTLYGIAAAGMLIGACGQPQGKHQVAAPQAGRVTGDDSAARKPDDARDQTVVEDHQREQESESATTESRPENIFAVESGRSAGAPPLNPSEQVVAAAFERRKNSKGKQRLENPTKRFQEWYRDRAGDDGVFTFDEVLAAKDHIERMSALTVGDTLRDAGVWNWEWLGPGNIGGRIRSIVIHPTQTDRMWVGAVSGGIWYSSNGGAYWSPVDDFLPSLAVGCMAIDPGNPNVMYAGTGEGFNNHDALPGAGIFKSTNGGVNWSQMAGTASWSNVNRIAIDPSDGSHLVVGTGGGIKTTFNGGASWSTDYGARAILDVKMDPNDSNTVVATGWDGLIYRSTDGGGTWTESPVYGTIGLTTFSAAFTPDGNTDDDTIFVNDTTPFAPGDNVTLGWETANENSRVVTVESATELVVEDLQNAHPVGDVFVSLPGGRTEIVFASSSPGVVYASMDVGRGAILKSTNGGGFFNVVSNTNDNYLGGQGWYDNTIWVAPNDPNLVVVGGIELFRSTDGGQTLARISHGGYYISGQSAHVDQHAIVHHPGYNGTSNRTVFFANDGGIQKVDDILTVQQTSGWTNLANNLGITQFYGGAATPDGKWIIGGTQDNDTLHLQDTAGPQGWYYGEFKTDGGYCAIDDSDPANPVFFKEAQNLFIKRSDDLGFTYVPKNNGLGDAGDGDKVRFIAPFVMNPQNHSVLVAGGTSIWMTTDSGEFWFAILGAVGGSPKCSAVEYSPSNGSRIWVGYEGGQIWRTTTDVLSWTRVDDNAPFDFPNRTVTDIAVNPSNDNEVFVTFAGYNSNSVWMTSDNGATWQERTGTTPDDLPALQVNSVRYHPNNTNWVYIGTDLGIFASEDKGMHWSTTPRFAGAGHEGPVNTEVSDLFWQGDRLIAATHGRGMYRTRPFVTVYVDKANTGFEDGSFSNPFDTVVEGTNAAGHGATISIEAGDYDEVGTILIEKRVDMVSTGGSAIIR